MGKAEGSMMMKPMMSQPMPKMSKGSQCVDGLKRTSSTKPPSPKRNRG